MIVNLTTGQRGVTVTAFVWAFDVWGGSNRGTCEVARVHLCGAIGLVGLLGGSVGTVCVCVYVFLYVCVYVCMSAFVRSGWIGSTLWMGCRNCVCMYVFMCVCV
jgi:hypothetical protein